MLQHSRRGQKQNTWFDGPISIVIIIKMLINYHQWVDRVGGWWCRGGDQWKFYVSTFHQWKFCGGWQVTWTLYTHTHTPCTINRSGNLYFCFCFCFPKCFKTATLRPRSCFSRPMMQKTEREADDGGAYGFPLLPLSRPPQPRQAAGDWVYEWTAGLASRRGPRENRAFDSGHILCE